MLKLLRKALGRWIPEPIKLALREPGHTASQFVRRAIFMLEIVEARIKRRRVPHLVISGPALTGKSTLGSMLSIVAATKVCHSKSSLDAVSTIGCRSEFFVTESCSDILHVDEIFERLNVARDLFFIILIRDPRALITTKNDFVPHQYHQSFDYQFFDPESGKTSFSNVGVVKILRAVKPLLLRRDVRFAVVRYEDIINDPEETVFKLSHEIEALSSDEIWETGRAQLRDYIKKYQIDNRELDQWLCPEHHERVIRQLHLCPELEEIAVSLGYPPASEYGFDLSVGPPRINEGTIIAFHTDDDVYRSEADRFTRRLDELGLKYDITVVPPRGEWVENCAMKSEFILEARKRLRGPLLYLDVDAYVHSDPWPYLSLYDGDMAAYVYTTGELNSATLWLADTPELLKMLEAWTVLQKEQRLEWDQRVLQQIVERDEELESPSYKFQRLPPNLNFLFDMQHENFFGLPVIEQLQVSREITDGKHEALERRRVRMAEIFSSTRPEE